jgi:type IV pilus assembly protein PilB
MGEKFSWDRLMKRGKGAEEDNTINLVPDKVEGPVAPLKASVVPQQQYKSAVPEAPPVVSGEAPPMNANRAPLVIDWDEFSKEEASQQTSPAPQPPAAISEPPLAPIDNIQPIEVPSSNPAEPQAKSGNFWDQLNKQTQEAMGQPAQPTAPTQSETPTPEETKPAVTGWDDVELTPREQTPAEPSESDVMAGTLNPDVFQPISGYQRPTEEEIKQKTDAIAQSNAWSEQPSAAAPVTPVVPAEPPVSTFIAPPTSTESTPVEEPLAPIQASEPPKSNGIETIDVGVSPFMNKPPTSNFDEVDPFKPTGNKLFGPEKKQPEVAHETPEAATSTIWNPVEEFAAPTGFESNTAEVAEKTESVYFEAYDSAETSGLPPIQEPESASLETVDFGSPVEQPTETFEEVTSEAVFEGTPADEIQASETEVDSDINTRVNQMLTAFDQPLSEAQPVEESKVEEACEQIPDHFVAEEEEEAPAFEDNAVEQTEETFDQPTSTYENSATESNIDSAYEQAPESFTEPKLTPENVTPEPATEVVEEPKLSTPEDFWASIPGAQSATNEEVKPDPVIEETVSVEAPEPVANEVDPDLERDLRTGDLLLKHKLVAPAQLERALARQSATKEKLGQVLISMGLISERRLLQVLASQKGVSPWHLEDDAPSQDAVQLVSHETCQLFQVLPVAVRGDMLLLAMRETQDQEAISAIRSVCGKRIEPVLADEVRLAYTIDEAYGVARDRGESALEQMVAIAHEHEINLSDGTIVNPERPDHLTALLRELMADAKRKSATSITIGFGEGQGEIFYRIHGRLCAVQSVPFELASSVLKTANADLEEQRIPFDIGADYKVAITTGQKGDNFVVTFPQTAAKINSLDELLIEGENLKLLRELTQRPYGLFLITGSVRSSKQSTMKALSQEMERQGRVVARASEGENIAEQINLAVTSESEVIVVGELENEADIRAAVKAASSGHLILAEVTANDAPTAIQQLISCGADPYLLATILTGVWSQALAPKLCLNCREAQGLLENERSLLDHYGMRHIQKVFESHGCDSCNHTGVDGQIVLSEVLPVSSDVSHLIANKAPVEEMAEQAGFAGYLPMDYDAMTRVIHGDVDFVTARRLVLFSLRELSAICRRDTWETQAS